MQTRTFRLSLHCMLASTLAVSVHPRAARCAKSAHSTGYHSSAVLKSLLHKQKQPVKASLSSAPVCSMSTAGIQYRPPIEVPAKAQHTASVIMLHGLGDTGEGWAGIAPQFASDLPHVKFIFPHAPLRAITINMGMKMPGWYDILSFDKITAGEDEQGLRESSRFITSLIQSELDAGIPSDRVVVAGFSQGGAVALFMLRSDLHLGGVVGMSTYLMQAEAPPLVSEKNKATPVLMAHGTADQVVRFEYGQMSKDRLQEAGVNVAWKVFKGMGHEAWPDELQQVLAFLQARLPATAKV